VLKKMFRSTATRKISKDFIHVGDGDCGNAKAERDEDDSPPNDVPVAAEEIRLVTERIVKRVGRQEPPFEKFVVIGDWLTAVLCLRFRLERWHGMELDRELRKLFAQFFKNIEIIHPPTA
jgi:hypothetical protein